jgi:polysaccharide biosynthesis/export protein
MGIAMTNKAIFVVLLAFTTAAVAQSVNANPNNRAAAASDSAANTGGETSATSSLPKKTAVSPLPIGAGDLIDLAVFDTPELSGRLRVNDQGEVLLPIGGTVHVAGLTAEQAAALIETRLKDQDILKSPHVNVFVSEYATQGVTVTGEVKSPGIYPLLGAHGLLDLISAAGGLTPTAGKAVTLLHKSDPQNPQIVLLNSAPEAAGQANVPVSPGDTVVVSRGGIVYVVGDVVRPGGFLIENNDRLTVLQSMALSQGANRTAALDRAKLIRKTAQGRQEIPIDLKRMLAGKVPDLHVEDGDILFIPSSAAKTATYRGLEGALSALGAVIYRF